MIVRIARVGVCSLYLFFFFNDTATTEIYTLSLHDALPILIGAVGRWQLAPPLALRVEVADYVYKFSGTARSEEHTSELQSQSNIVCRLLLEKKKNNDTLSCCHATFSSGPQVYR